jgi:hypothetical protein
VARVGAVEADQRGRVRSRAAGGVRVAGRPGWSDTKTPKSRRTLVLRRRCARRCGSNGCGRLRTGSQRDGAGRMAGRCPRQLRRHRRMITMCGRGSARQPRLRDQAASDTTGVVHTLASLVSAHGVLIETIALLADRYQTATTELAYRHQINPAMPRSWTESSATRPAVLNCSPRRCMNPPALAADGDQIGDPTRARSRRYGAACYRPTWRSGPRITAVLFRRCANTHHRMKRAATAARFLRRRRERGTNRAGEDRITDRYHVSGRRHSCRWGEPDLAGCTALDWRRDKGAS